MSVPSYVPKLVQNGQTTATTYHFRIEPRGPFGWALCTVNDRTGELLITSDWGDWSHRWNPQHLGTPTLTDFITDRSSCHYLANKLARENGPRSGTEFDVDETIARFRTMLAEARLAEGREEFLVRKGRGAPLSAGYAREIWDEIGSLSDCGRSAELFCERFLLIEGCEWVTSEPWEYTVYTPTTGYMVLLHGILPALVEACAAEVKQRIEFEAKYIELPPAAGVQ